MMQDNKLLEALGILQEECAEVIQEVSKIRRFGLDTANYKSDMQHTHRTMLEMEIADVLVLVDFLVENSVISLDNLEIYKAAKIEKLKKWSTIYEQN